MFVSFFTTVSGWAVARLVVAERVLAAWLATFRSSARALSLALSSTHSPQRSHSFSSVDAYTDVAKQFVLQAGVNTLWLTARELCTLATQLTVA